jgi:hypothetical protein
VKRVTIKKIDRIISRLALLFLPFGCTLPQSGISRAIDSGFSQEQTPQPTVLLKAEGHVRLEDNTPIARIKAVEAATLIAKSNLIDKLQLQPGILMPRNAPHSSDKIVVEGKALTNFPRFGLIYPENPDKNVITVIAFIEVPAKNATQN